MFDPDATDLTGTRLIEASAGTGKTFNIASLVVRAIREGVALVDQILVVTFTKAATAELRSRVRSRLETARRAEKDSEKAERLEYAVRDFDQARIFTIHGFCQQILRDRAFECARTFDTELIQDDSALMQQVADDFWWQLTMTEDPIVTQLLLASDIKNESFLKFHHWPRYDRENVLPARDENFDFGSIVELFSTIQTLKQNIRDIWNGTDLPKPSKTDQGSINRWLSTVSRLLPGTRVLTWLRGRIEFRDDIIALEQACRDLEPLQQAFKVEISHRWMEFRDRETSRRKQAANIQYFDDLIRGLEATLDGPSGPAIISKLREDYPLVLIDEFQDTDPVQTRIFQRCFGGAADPEHPRGMFYIGDPKQSIYRFRGADIHAYISAKLKATDCATLGTNYRSTKPMVDAVNALFSRIDDPFQHEQIPFVAVEANGEKKSILNRPPMRLRFLPKAGFRLRNKGISNKDAAARTLDTLTQDVVDLLANHPEIKPGSVAVLVTTNDLGRDVQDALHQAGIASVRACRQTVFQTPEAKDLYQLLHAIDEPHRASIVRGALAGNLYRGLDDKLVSDEPATIAQLEPELARFHHLRDMWLEHGFLVMFRSFLRECQVLEEWAGTVNGERAITNLLHLGELLGQSALQESLGPTQLIQWFSTQIQSSSVDGDDNVIRLESDGDRVQIATLHVAKGLEYDFVFIPFCWRGGWTTQAVPFQGLSLFDEERMARVLELGDPARNDKVLARHARERAQESMRLLYVGLTRAVQECTVYYAPSGESGRTALHRLLFPASISIESSDTEMLDALRTHQERSPSLFQVDQFLEPNPDCVLPPRETDSTAACVPLRRNHRIGKIRRITSFSSLKSSRPENYEEPDHDDVPDAIGEEPSLTRSTAAERLLAEQDPDETTQAILEFPKGTRTGNMLHEIFEHIDFTQPTSSAPTQEVISRRLHRHRFAVDDQALVTSMVERVLQAPLPGIADQEEPPFKLADIADTQRLNEMEFFFHLDLKHKEELAAFFDHRLSPPQLFGCLKGFIDLIVFHGGRFHLLDYKSNYLGPRLIDYGHHSLDQSMQHHLYDVQYQIYLVALHRYLSKRLSDYRYEEHMGDVHYLFLRAMGVPGLPDGIGVHSTRPSADRIEQLSSLLGHMKTTQT